jgi:hypothetical protein
MKARQRKRQVAPPTQFIGVLRLKPGDRLVVCTETPPIHEEAQKLSDFLDAQVVFIRGANTRLSVIPKT